MPAESTRYYEQLTTLRGAREHFVQLYVDRPGHCRFTADEMAEALERLTIWIEDGEMPEAGDITVR